MKRIIVIILFVFLNINLACGKEKYLFLGDRHGNIIILNEQKGEINKFLIGENYTIASFDYFPNYNMLIFMYYDYGEYIELINLKTQTAKKIDFRKLGYGVALNGFFKSKNDQDHCYFGIVKKESAQTPGGGSAADLVASGISVEELYSKHMVYIKYSIPNNKFIKIGKEEYMKQFKNIDKKKKTYFYPLDKLFKAKNEIKKYFKDNKKKMPSNKARYGIVGKKYYIIRDGTLIEIHDRISKKSYSINRKKDGYISEVLSIE